MNLKGKQGSSYAACGAAGNGCGLCEGSAMGLLCWFAAIKAFCRGHTQDNPSYGKAGDGKGVQVAHIAAELYGIHRCQLWPSSTWPGIVEKSVARSSQTA